MVPGWPRARWWTSALHFWDDFSADGELGPDAADPGPVGCRLRAADDLAPGATATYTFLITWHFPNRTPDRCGWDAPEGQGGSMHRQPLLHAVRGRVGGGALHGVEPARDWNRRTRLFAEAFRESTLPAAVKDGASANLSTLVTQTCFRTADGEFHGFEGCGDHERLLRRQLHARLELRDRDRSTCSRALRARCAAPPSAIRWTRTAACASASCCPTASIASRRPPPTARWARS